MKAFRYMLVWLTVAALAFCIVGCGVSKEEHEKVVAELGKANAELTQLKAKQAGADKALSEAKAQAEEAAKSAKGTEEKLAAAEQQAKDLQALIDDMKKKLDSVKKPK